MLVSLGNDGRIPICWRFFCACHLFYSSSYSSFVLGSSFYLPAIGSGWITKGLNMGSFTYSILWTAYFLETLSPKLKLAPFWKLLKCKPWGVAVKYAIMCGIVYNFLNSFWWWLLHWTKFLVLTNFAIFLKIGHNFPISFPSINFAFCIRKFVYFIFYSEVHSPWGMYCSTLGSTILVILKVWLGYGSGLQSCYILTTFILSLITQLFKEL